MAVILMDLLHTGIFLRFVLLSNVIFEFLLIFGDNLRVFWSLLCVRFRPGCSELPPAEGETADSAPRTHARRAGPSRPDGALEAVPPGYEAQHCHAQRCDGCVYAA